MNDSSQHEIDDELLSAYLDDELSAEERALVEDRLAADPAARHTLEQLRSVSQAIRDLPKERIGHDLRDSILRRAAEKAASNQPASRAVPGPESPLSTQSQAPSTHPTVTLGRTTRSWLWASAAIAAALLITVLQPATDRNADLPAVAQRDQPRAESASPMDRQLADNQLSGRAGGSEMAPAAAAPEPPAPPVLADAPQDLAASGQLHLATPPAADSASPGDRFEQESLAAHFRGEAIQDQAAAMAQPDARQPVVVRVLVRHAAVENNAFEELLRKHNVDVEPSVQGLDKAKVVATEAKDHGSQRESGSGDNGNVELVLVDAPSSTIFSCMSELKSDDKNYLGIAVEDAPPSDESPADAPAAEKKQASAWERFNRGIVPPSRESLADADYYFGYWDDKAAVDHPTLPQSVAKGVELYEGKKLEETALADESRTDRGRARRLQMPADAKFTPPRAAAEQAVPATPSDGRMQVLFVIRPTNDPAPSLKAKNKPE